MTNEIKGKHSTQIPHKEGVDVNPEREPRNVFAELVAIANETFNDTHLVEEGELDESDIEATYEFYRQAAEINSEVFNTSTREHLLLTEEYARLIGQLLVAKGIDLDLTKVRVGALLHDIGRTFSHRRARNDRIGHMILQRAHVRTDIEETILPDNKFAPPKQWSQTKKEAHIESIDELIDPPYQAIIVIADVLAKFITEQNGQRRLRRWDEVITQTRIRQNDPKNGNMWPSELERQTAILANFGSVATLYSNIGNWLEETIGITINDVVKQMSTELASKPLDLNKI